MKNSNQLKKVVLFVGGFRVGNDGTEGGQVFACRSLVDSPLKEHVTWKLVDSTQRSEPPPTFVVRLFDGLMRMIRVLGMLFFTKVDVVLVFTGFLSMSILEKGIYCLTGKLLGKRVVISFRSFPKLPKTGTRLFRWLLTRICRSCDRIIFQSQQAVDELSRLLPFDSEKVAVINNWIDTSRFRDSTQRRANPDGKIRIIYVGWLHPVKGIEFVMQAMSLLAKVRSDFVLSVCGGGGLHDLIQRQRVEFGLKEQVKILGWVRNEEVFSRMYDSDIFLLPSLSEGMPNALLQAMGCGLPVVTTDVCSIPSIVQEGRNGSLIQPGSSQEICDGILRLIAARNKWLEMGNLNREQIIRGHDIDNVWPTVAGILGVKL